MQTFLSRFLLGLAVGLLVATLLHLVFQSGSSASPASLSVERAESLESRLDRILLSLETLGSRLEALAEKPAAMVPSGGGGEISSGAARVEVEAVDILPLTKSLDKAREAIEAFSQRLRAVESESRRSEELSILNKKAASLNGFVNFQALEDLIDFATTDSEATSRSLMFRSSEEILNRFGVPQSFSEENWNYFIPSVKGYVHIYFDHGYVSRLTAYKQ